jgi:hypothetical protein
LYVRQFRSFFDFIGFQTESVDMGIRHNNFTKAAITKKKHYFGDTERGDITHVGNRKCNLLESSVLYS